MDGMMVRQSSVMVVSEPDRGPLSPRPSLLLLLLCCGRHAPLLLLRSIGLSMRLRGSVCGGYYEAPLSGCAFVPCAVLSPRGCRGALVGWLASRVLGC
jgi:hypothetical protein